MEQPEPDYYVPDGVKYTITLDGTDLKEQDTESVGIVAPGFELLEDVNHEVCSAQATGRWRSGRGPA